MTGASLTDAERATLLEPCACGHDFEDHGGLGNCWTCLDDNRECDRNFEDLLCERVAVIVEGRAGAVSACPKCGSRGMCNVMGGCE